MCSASGPGCARGGAQGPGEALALQEAATPGPAPLRGLWCRSAGQWASSTRGWAHQCPVVSPARQEGLASPCPGPSGLSTPWHQLGALGTAAPEWKAPWLHEEVLDLHEMLSEPRTPPGTLPLPHKHRAAWQQTKAMSFPTFALFSLMLWLCSRGLGPHRYICSTAGAQEQPGVSSARL